MTVDCQTPPRVYLKARRWQTGSTFFYWSDVQSIWAAKQSSLSQATQWMHSITALHLMSGHVALSVFPWADAFCRLDGHGATIASKHPWRWRTNSLTKASTSRLFPTLHGNTPMWCVFCRQDDGINLVLLSRVCFWANFKACSGPASVLNIVQEKKDSIVKQNKGLAYVLLQ